MLLFLYLSFGFFLILFLIVGLFAFFGNEFVSDSLDDLELVLSELLDSGSESQVLLNRWVEFHGSSSVLQEDLVDALLVWVSVIGNWFDSISVVFEILVVIGVVFALGHAL